MERSYSESRISILIIVGCVLAQGLFLTFGFTEQLSLPITVGISVGILVLFLLFYSLHVYVQDGSLFIVYGIGLICTEVPLTTIGGYEIIPNSYLTWVYEPGLSHVLRLQLRDGKTVIVGIGEPKRLQMVIRQENRG